MPYTLSHAIVALPLHHLTRGKIPLAAVVVGSISPDFPYLLALTPMHAPGHSLIGVLIYCLIPSLLVLVAWYRLLESSTLELFVLPIRKWKFNKLSYLQVLIGVLLGSYSHVVWDATSHFDGAFVHGSVFWNQELFSLPLYKLNQYFSGVLGLITLAVWYLVTVLRNRPNQYKGHIFIGALCYWVSIVSFIVLANVLHDSNTALDYAIHSSIGVIPGAFYGACIYAFLVHLRKRSINLAPKTSAKFPSNS
jgi:multidrug transporter EmrE-like cation transporter